MNIYLDIETIPTQPQDAARELIALDIKPPGAMSKPETIAAWHAGEGKYAGAKDAAIDAVYRKTSLDGTWGEVISIAVVTDKGEVVVGRKLGESESALLQEFCALVEKESAQRPPWFVGHNITFDLKFLWQRCIVNNVRPSFTLPFSGRHNTDFYCTMQAWAGYGQRISQNNLCRALHLPQKPDGIDGARVWDAVLAGEYDRLREYNLYDACTVRDIFRRLEGLGEGESYL